MYGTVECYSMVGNDGMLIIFLVILQCIIEGNEPILTSFTGGGCTRFTR